MDAPDAVFRLPVSEGARLVLVLLWRYAGAGQDPVVWPSAARLADQTGMAVRSVERLLRALREAGAISRCRRPASAHTTGPAWRLNADPTPTPESVLADNPDPAVGPTPTAQSASPRPYGHPDPAVGPTPTVQSDDPDSSVGTPPTQRSDRTNHRTTNEPTIEPPPPVFALASPSAEPAPKPKAVKASKPIGGCTAEQWAAVLDAYAEAREIGGMAPAWGRMRDNPTNRKHAGRIWADGYTPEDLRTVMRHIGQGLAAGTHEPKWTSLEHVARSMGRYLHEAAAGPPKPRQNRGAINPLCAPIVAPDDAPAPQRGPNLMPAQDF